MPDDTATPRVAARLHANFGAELVGVSIRRDLPAAQRAALLAALDAHGVVVIRDQRANSDELAAFAASLGTIWVPMQLKVLQQTLPGRAGTAANAVFRLTNLAADGTLTPRDSRAMEGLNANELWHTDATYSTPGARASFLLGIVVPPEGADTELCDTRIACETLPRALRRRIEGRIAHHSMTMSATRSGYGNRLTPEEAERYPPVPRPLLRRHAQSGRDALCIASHICGIEGLSEGESEALLADLLAHATAPERVYRHRWRAGDLLIWDNRSALHRATPFDSSRYLRDMLTVRIVDDAEL